MFEHGQRATSSATTRSRRPRPHATRPSGWARSPSSATSTAHRCASCGPGPHSLEFCGGTHVERARPRSGRSALVSEARSGRTRRRIEAVTGKARWRGRSSASAWSTRRPSCCGPSPTSCWPRDRPAAGAPARGRAGARPAAPAGERGRGRRRWRPTRRRRRRRGGARRDAVEPDELRSLAQAVLRHDGVQAVVLGGTPDGATVAIAAATGGDPRRHRARAGARRAWSAGAAGDRPSWRWPAAGTRRSIDGGAGRGAAAPGRVSGAGHGEPAPGRGPGRGPRPGSRAHRRGLQRQRRAAWPARGGRSSAAAIRRVTAPRSSTPCARWTACAVVVGLPLSLSGRAGPAARGGAGGGRRRCARELEPLTAWRWRRRTSGSRRSRRSARCGQAGRDRDARPDG